ncbi:hypothetical protein LV476_11070 [Guyparkeria hydrothermalis]|uniref:hypothetical protein n=1 Tax=Guyparkeria hydrothermalis TaxID=923 RepID=UPI002021AB42|nr:hypothetical protein [Guyparkeria hydrothermalis]MCL7745476.1 hypothetical protein [Guyparkeria hydrothermalis]
MATICLVGDSQKDLDLLRGMLESATHIPTDEQFGVIAGDAFSTEKLQEAGRSRPEGHFLILSRSLKETIADGIRRRAGDPREMLSGWLRSQREKLSFCKDHPSRCLMVAHQAVCDHPDWVAEVVRERWDLPSGGGNPITPSTPEGEAGAADPLPWMLAQMFIERLDSATTAEIDSLETRIVGCPLSSERFHDDTGRVDEAIRGYGQLVEQAGAGDRTSPEQGEAATLLAQLDECHQRIERHAQLANRREQALIEARETVDELRSGAQQLLTQLQETQTEVVRHAYLANHQEASVDELRHELGEYRAMVGELLVALHRSHEETEHFASKFNDQSWGHIGKRFTGTSKVLEYDSVRLVGVKNNPDYEHIVLMLENVRWGGQKLDRWGFRLSSANLGPCRFGQRPKLEVPAQPHQWLQGWFPESRDTHGGKWELRFEAPNTLDMAVLKRLPRSDRTRVGELLERLPAMLHEVFDMGGSNHSRADWVRLAETMRDIHRDRVSDKGGRVTDKVADAGIRFKNFRFIKT